MPDWVQIIVTFVVALVAAKFLPSYMTEKGKNVATKEDIHDITKIVEEARKEYIHEVEMLRNEFHIHREDITSVRTKGREALVEFF
jgi:hypothetical protein